MKKALFNVLQFLIVIGLLATILEGMELAVLQNMIGHYSGLAIFIMMLFNIFIYIPLGYRLKHLSKHQSSTRINTLATFICHGVNNILPGKLGELAKIYYIAKHSGLTKTYITSVIFWERFLDVNVLLLFSLILFWTVDYQLVLCGLIGVVLAVWVMIWGAKYHHHRLSRMIERLPFQRLKKMAHQLHALLHEQLTFSYLGLPSLMSLLIWLCYLVQTYLIFNWIADFQLGWGDTLVIYVMISVAWAVPLTPGAIGVLEATIVLVLSWHGVGKEEAFLVAMIIRMLDFIPSLLISGVIMLNHRFSVGDFKRSLG